MVETAKLEPAQRPPAEPPAHQHEDGSHEEHAVPRLIITPYRHTKARHDARPPPARPCVLLLPLPP